MTLRPPQRDFSPAIASFSWMACKIRRGIACGSSCCFPFQEARCDATVDRNGTLVPVKILTGADEIFSRGLPRDSRR